MVSNVKLKDALVCGAAKTTGIPTRPSGESFSKTTRAADTRAAVNTAQSICCLAAILTVRHDACQPVIVFFLSVVIWLSFTHSLSLSLFHPPSLHPSLPLLCLRLYLSLTLCVCLCQNERGINMVAFSVQNPITIQTLCLSVRVRVCDS